MIRPGSILLVLVWVAAVFIGLMGVVRITAWRSDLQDAQRSLQETIASLTRERSGASEELDRSRSQIVQLTSQLETVEKVQQGLTKALEESENKLARQLAAAPPSVEKLKGAQRQLMSREVDLEQSKEQLTKLEWERMNLKKRLEQTSWEQADLSEELKELKVTLKEGEYQLSKVHVDRDHYENRVEVLRELLDRRETELSEMKKEFSQSQAQIQELTRRLKRESKNVQRERAHERERMERTLAKTEEARDKLALQLENERLDREKYERFQKEFSLAKERIAELVLALDVQEQLAAELAERYASR